MTICTKCDFRCYVYVHLRHSIKSDNGLFAGLFNWLGWCGLLGLEILFSPLVFLGGCFTPKTSLTCARADYKSCYGLETIYMAIPRSAGVFSSFTWA